MKIVSLKGENGKRVMLLVQKQTEKFLTMIQAKILLYQGCQAYLAHVVETEKKIPKIREILVVREFQDVFPDHFQGLPPDKEVELMIDLALSNGPCRNERIGNTITRVVG